MGWGQWGSRDTEFYSFFNVNARWGGVSGGVGIQSPTLSLTSALDGMGGHRHVPAALPSGKYPIPIVEEAGWAPRPVWTTGYIHIFTYLFVVNCQEAGSILGHTASYDTKNELYKNLEGRYPSLMQVVLETAFRASEQLRKSSVRMAGRGEGTNRVPAEYDYECHRYNLLPGGEALSNSEAARTHLPNRHTFFVIPFKADWLCAPTGWTLQNWHSAPTLFICFVFISEQRATCAPYNISWLVFITEKKSVYSAVRTGSLNKAVCASALKG